MFRGAFFFSICIFFVKKILFSEKWRFIENEPMKQVHEKQENIPIEEDEWGQFIDIEIY